MISLKDMNWLVGLLEGEGTFVFQKVINQRGVPGYVPKIQVVTGDADVIERAAKLLGVETRRPYFPSHTSGPMYMAYLGGKKAAKWMQILYSHMGARRQAQIEYCLRRWRTRT